MKQLFANLILMAVMLFSLPANAQFESMIAEASPVYSQDSGIVRYWKEHKFISCNKMNDAVEFTLMEDNNAIVRYVGSYREFNRVYDFQILDDYVYFCGELVEGNNRRTVIGRFDIPGIYSNLINYELVILPNIQKLDKLVVYNPGNPHIVAIGNETTYNITRGFMLECYYDNYMNTFSGITTYQSLSTTAPKFHDIVETYSNVVVVAEKGNLCLYRCPKNNIQSGIMGNEYNYPTPYTEPLGFIVATSMQEELMVTANFASKDKVLYTNNIRVFDVSNMNMVNAQAIYQQGSGFNNDIVYVPHTNTVVLSQNHYNTNIGANATSLVDINPYSYSNYNSYIMHIPQYPWQFVNIDVMASRYILSVYGLRWFAKDMSQPADFSGQSCYTSHKEQVDIIEVTETRIEASPFIMTMPEYYIDSYMRGNSFRNINIKCINK